MKIKFTSHSSFWGTFILNFFIISIWIVLVHSSNQNYVGLLKQLILTFIVCFIFSLSLFGGDSIELSNNTVVQRRFWVKKSPAISTSQISRIEKKNVNYGFTRFSLYSIFFLKDNREKELRLGAYSSKKMKDLIDKLLELNPRISFEENSYSGAIKRN